MENVNNKKNGWKIGFIVLLVLVVLGIVAAFVVPSFIGKKDDNNKEQPKEETVEKPEDLTKDSKTVKDLFETYRVSKYGISTLELLYTNEKDFTMYLDINNDNDYVSNSTRLFYAVTNSYEKDTIACSNLKHKFDGVYKSCYINNCDSEGENCKFDNNTKTKYAKLDNVKAKYKELFNTELTEDIYDVTTPDMIDEDTVFALDWYVPITYSKEDKMFINLNYYSKDEGLWSESNICSEDLNDIKVNGNTVDIYSVLHTGIAGDCSEEFDVKLMYRFKYDANAKKYVLSYVYFFIV